MKYNFLLLLLTLIPLLTSCTKPDTEYIFSSDSEFVNIGYHFTDSAETFLSERREQYGVEQLLAEVCTTFTDNKCENGSHVYVQMFLEMYSGYFQSKYETAYDIIISLRKEDITDPMLIKFSMFRYPDHIDLGAFTVTNQGMTTTTDVYVHLNL